MGLPLTSTAWCGWPKEQKLDTAGFEARLKLIEARLKITKNEPDEIIVINDSYEESNVDEQNSFNPTITSTRIKSENEKSFGNI